MANANQRKLPPIHKHKTGQARTRIAGKDFYLGAYGTPEAEEEYLRLCVECWPPGDRGRGVGPLEVPVGHGAGRPS